MNTYPVAPCSRCRQMGGSVVYQRQSGGAVIRRCECGTWEQWNPEMQRWNERPAPDPRDLIVGQ